MKHIEPAAVWNLDPWGNYTLRIADVNGDGRAEVLVLQSAGAHANSHFDPRIPGGSSYKTGAEDQELFCMTLLDQQGRILWQIGEPWRLDRPYSWNGHWAEFCQILDLDGDGNNEIVLVHKGELRVYDALTGRLRQTRPLPNEAFSYVQPVRADRSGRYHLFTKSGSTSHTHSMGNPSLLLDHQLQVVWEKDGIPGAGHRANFADVDGDGLDEMVIGFGLYDHDGTPRWVHQPFADDDHLDDSAIADLDGDGEHEIALAHDGYDAVVHNLDGSERFRLPMHHCQEVQAGRFFGDLPGQQLLAVDKPVGSAREREAVVVDGQGRELSRHQSLGYCSRVNWPTSIGPQSLVRIERPVELDGEHRVVWVDPTGAELARFEVPASFSEYIRKHRLDRLNTRRGHEVYYGVTYTPAIGDLDGDGREELLITDRHRVWLFRQP